MGVEKLEVKQQQYNFLPDDFLEKFDDFPKHMSPLGKFVYLRTYSRYLHDKGRRETWKETCARAVNYNISLAFRHLNQTKQKFEYSELVKEAKRLFKSMYNLHQFLSGRTLWVGGADTGVAEKFPLANFNCSFTTIRRFDDIADLFYLLLVGTGVGVKVTKKMAKQLPKVNTKIEAYNERYVPVPKEFRQEDTSLAIFNREGKKVAKITIGDSKEGWADAVRIFFKIISEKEYRDIQLIEFNYNNIRPKGERLRTFGGTASGPQPLMEMFDGFIHVLRNQIDDMIEPIEVDENGYGQLRPIHYLDIINLIGNNVVVGGVRRTSEIFLFDSDDFEVMFAKYGINGIWDEQNHREVIRKLRNIGQHKIADYLEKMKLFDVNVRPLHHRRMSNNSVAFTEKPDRKLLNLIFTMMKAEGEPGFVNLREAGLRRLKGKGIQNPTEEQLQEEMENIGFNPCAEILLSYYGVCNLTTVNVASFVKTDDNGNKYLDLENLLQAQRDSARAGLRMTLVTLELPHWDEIQKRDRLLGTSVTGWKDAVDQLGLTKQEEDELKKLLGDTARQEAKKYAKELGVNEPLLVTTVKPEGTLSQVAGGVSSGVHYAFAPYFIRRIRINADDPLAKAVLEHKGWKVYAEVGTEGYIKPEDLAKPEVIKKAKTLVIDFPNYSGARVTENEATIEEQFDNYFSFQENYVDHNASNTMKVSPHEWGKAEEIVYNNWDRFTAVSFLARDGGSYTLAPYEAIDKETYEKMVKEMQDFDMSILDKYEIEGDSETSLEGMEGCEGGACGIR